MKARFKIGDKVIVTKSYDCNNTYRCNHPIGTKVVIKKLTNLMDNKQPAIAWFTDKRGGVYEDALELQEQPEISIFN